VERSTRFTMLLHLPSMPGHGGPRAKNGPPLAGRGAEAVRDAITNQITTLPEQLRRSLTWDQGAEMAKHAELRIATGLPVYFCDPHSPGSAALTRTPTACSGSTSRRAQTSQGTPPRTSPRSLPRSTVGLERRSAGEPPPRRSMSTFARQHQRRRRADPQQCELASIQPARLRSIHHNTAEREARTGVTTHPEYGPFGVVSASQEEDNHTT